MKEPLPIVFIGDDYDDFSIFDLAVQETNQARKVFWVQSPASFLSNPIPECYIVVDMSAYWTPVEYDVKALGSFAITNSSFLFVYTTNVQKVALMMEDVKVEAFIFKYDQFDVLVGQLKTLFYF